MNEDVLSMLGKEEPQVEEKKTSAVASDKIDKDVFASMLTADGKDGNFTEDKEPEVPESDKPDVVVSAGKVKEKLGKYEDEFMENVMKHPDKYYVDTPRGTMSIKDAIMEGWDPKTGEFDEAKSINKMKEDQLGRLNDSDRAAVEHIMDPANAGIAAADAEGLGLDPGSNMIAQAPQALMPEGGAPQEGAPALPGGTPQAGAAPTEGGQPQIDPAVLQKMLGGSI